MCSRLPDKEWSGLLFYTYTGSFKNDTIKFLAEDFLLMDIGDATYTHFISNPDFATYIAEHPELAKSKTGIIHSHNKMEAFFSGTDNETLLDCGKDTIHFLSLIVNNAGRYVAAVTTRTEVKDSIVRTISLKSYDQKTVTKKIPIESCRDEIMCNMLNVEFQDLNTEEIAERYKAISERVNTESRQQLGNVSYPYLFNRSKENSYSSYFDEYDKDRGSFQLKPDNNVNSIKDFNLSIPVEALKIANKLVFGSICPARSVNSYFNSNKLTLHMESLYKEAFKNDFTQFGVWIETMLEYLLNVDELVSLSEEEENALVLQVKEIINKLKESNPQCEYLSTISECLDNFIEIDDTEDISDNQNKINYE